MTRACGFAAAAPAACVHCGKMRRPKNRGLCVGCFRTHSIRERYPDPRTRHRVAGRSVAERDATLAVTPPGQVAALAYKVGVRYGRLDLIPDLTQVGWLYLVQAARTWDGTGAFLGYAWKGLKGRMHEYASREFNWPAPLGAAGRDFDAIDRRADA